MQNFSSVKPLFSASLFFKVFLFLCLVFAATRSSANPTAPIRQKIGCKVGNRIYWDEFGSGFKDHFTGVTVFHFRSLGAYTQWDNDYALRQEHRCDSFISTSAAHEKCSVLGGTQGTRGQIITNMTNCPLDSHLVLLGMGITLFVLYFYHSKKLSISL